MTGLERFNALTRSEAEAELLGCCGSRRWARRLARARPFSTIDELLESAGQIWDELPDEDRLEAFAAHPRIGERSSGRAAREQSGTRGASEETLAALARANRDYEKRFGHIFIVCASGKSAQEMLDLCLGRIHNDPRMELQLAFEEQKKITRLRLMELMETRLPPSASLLPVGS